MGFLELCSAQSAQLYMPALLELVQSIRSLWFPQSEFLSLLPALPGLRSIFLSMRPPIWR